jgi:hypothetical protein
MSRRWPTGRTHEEDEPGSAAFSRVLVAGFLIAALLGLLSGLGWMAWRLVTE